MTAQVLTTAQLRSERMRARLIEATIVCLDQFGHGDTTIDRIASIAEVSRGSIMHHFESKAGLLEATAEALIHQLHDRLVNAVEQLPPSNDRLRDMIFTSWHTLYGERDSHAFMELLIASRRDDEIACIMTRLGQRGLEILDRASQHYFVCHVPGVSPTRFFILTHWVMQGLAIERHLFTTPEQASVELDHWVDLLRTRLNTNDEKSAIPARNHG